MLEGALFERGGRQTPEIDGEQVKELHAKIGEPAGRNLKYACIYLHAWKTGSEPKAGVGNGIAFYIRKHPHSVLGGRPPAMVYWLRTDKTQPDQQEQRVA